MVTHIWTSMALTLSPRKYLSGKFCFSFLKSLCKAYHKLFYDKFIIMRSHSKFTSDYQDVTILLLISALHNNMVVMPSFYLNVRTNGYQKAYF